MIEITNEQKQEIVEHARAAGKNEACGILAGKNGKIERIYKMTNVSDNAENCYFMDPKEQIKVIKEIRNSGLHMVAIYHSHPLSPAYPSERDVELAFYPEAVYIIVSLLKKEPEFRAFKIIQGKIAEEEIKS